MNKDTKPVIIKIRRNDGSIKKIKAMKIIREPKKVGFNRIRNKYWNKQDKIIQNLRLFKSILECENCKICKRHIFNIKDEKEI